MTIKTVNNSDILLEICVVLRQLDIVNLLTFWPYPVKMLNCTEGKRPSETQNARSSTAGRFEENNMKKFVTAIILVCMMLSMAACGGSSEAEYKLAQISFFVLLY